MKTVCLFVLLAASIPLHAQTTGTLTLSLGQALQLGLQNRFDLKAGQYDIALARNKVSKSKKAWIPEISAEGNLQYNTQLQPTIIPKGVLGNAEAEMVAMGSKHVSTFGLSLNQPVFKPDIHTNVKIDKTAWNLQQEKVRGQQMEVKNAIATAYLDVLLKRLQCQIAQKEESRFKQYQALAEGKYENGALIKNDYLRAKLDLENAKVRTAALKQEYDLAISYLKYQINVPEETGLTLSDSISSIAFSDEPVARQKALDNRTEIRQLKWKQQENKLNIKAVKQQAMPVISLQGYYAMIYQNESLHYGQSKWWAPHSFIGLDITIPITGNIANKNNIRRFQLQQQQLALDLKQREADVRYEVQKARADLKNAAQNRSAAQNNYNLAQTIYHNQQQQFAIGVFRYSDLLDTEKSLHDAEAGYIRAVFEYLSAQIAYRRAEGQW